MDRRRLRRDFHATSTTKPDFYASPGEPAAGVRPRAKSVRLALLRATDRSFSVQLRSKRLTSLRPRTWPINSVCAEPASFFYRTPKIRFGDNRIDTLSPRRGLYNRTRGHKLHLIQNYRRGTCVARNCVIYVCVCVCVSICVLRERVQFFTPSRGAGFFFNAYRNKRSNVILFKVINFKFLTFGLADFFEILLLVSRYYNKLFGPEWFLNSFQF